MKICISCEKDNTKTEKMQTVKRSIMFSILKKIFAGISGKSESQVPQEIKAGFRDKKGKKRSSQKSERKDQSNQESLHKQMRKPLAEDASAVPAEPVQKKETSLPKACGKKNRKASAKAHNRHGIPVYEKHADFSKYFAEESEKTEAAAKECQTAGLAGGKSHPVRREKQPPAASKVPRSVPRNRHGIPLFRKDDDLFRYFREEAFGEMYRQPPERSSLFPLHSPDSGDAADDFQTLLRHSLGESGREEMLKKKFAGLASAPFRPLRKAIADYPPPQEVMDLHGCTAEQAEEKTEAFIRKAGHKGMRTLLIIVGKGLHSEGRAVLPDVVENRLLLLKKQNRVLAYEWEKKIQRKSGALIVYLNDPG